MDFLQWNSIMMKKTVEKKLLGKKEFLNCSQEDNYPLPGSTLHHPRREYSEKVCGVGSREEQMATEEKKDITEDATFNIPVIPLADRSISLHHPQLM